MKKVLFIVCCITQIAYSQIPGFDWAVGNSGVGNDLGLATITDAQGNIYSTGSFKSTIDFDPGSGTTSIASNGGDDVYIQKLSPAGNLIWAVGIGNSGNELGRAITIDANGDILVTGSFTSTAVDFDPGSGTTILSGDGTLNIFVLKLTSSGTLVWAKSIGGTGDDVAFTICSDANSNVFIGGHFWGGVDFDPGPGINTVTSTAIDAFALKLDVNGNYVWVAPFHSNSESHVNSIKTNSSGEVVMVGYFIATMDLDPGIGTNNLTSASIDGFIIKLNQLGNLIWGKQLGGVNNEVYYDFDIDHLGDIITTGYCQGGADFDPGPATFTLPTYAGTDAFIQKLDTDANLIWAKVFGSVTNDNGYGIDVDELGNIVSTGYYSGTVDFDPAVGIFSNHTAIGSVDAYIQKLDINGNFVWAKTFGGTGDDIPRGISIAPAGDIAVTGYYQVTVDFDPTGNTFNLTSGGGYDSFTSHFQCTPTSNNITASSCISYTSPSGNYVWTSSGTFQDTLANISGCDSIITINLTIDLDLNVSVLNGIFSVNQTGATYQWLDCNTNTSISGATSQTFIPTSNGSYACVVTNGVCSDTTICTIINNVSIEQNNQTVITIYPNPANDFVVLTTGVEMMEIELIDITGKTMVTPQGVKGKTYFMDVSSLSEGSYILRIKTINGMLFKKLILQ